MAGGISSLPCQPRSRHPPALPGAEEPGAEGRGGSRRERRRQGSSSGPLPSAPCQGTGQPPGVGRPEGHRQPREEAEAIAPSRSPEQRCYIYPPAGPGLGLSPVTQALQPARIRGDGTFLSKNSPPAAGERAGVEVTDWTAAPDAPLAGDRHPRPVAPRDHPGHQPGHRASPLPRGAELGAWVSGSCLRAGPGATPGAREQAQPQGGWPCLGTGGCTASPPRRPCWLRVSGGSGLSLSPLHCPAPETCPCAS